MFKIRNAAGLFSTGGAYPYFTKSGKAWNKPGYVRSHLKQLRQADGYRGCVVVEYAHHVTAEFELHTFAADEGVKAAIVKVLRAEKYKECRRKLYEELKQEFE